MKVCVFSYNPERGWQNLPDYKELNSANTLVMAFCSPHYRENSGPLQELHEMFPDSIVTGCSTSGEIMGSHINDLSISVSAIKFDDSRLRLEVQEIMDPEKSFAAGSRLSEKLFAEDLRGAIILSDGLSANGTTLIRGFNQNIDTTKVSVAGGLAGDGNHFKHTWVLYKGAPVQNLIVAVGLYGQNLAFSSSSRGGWDLFGPERRVTKSNGNVVYEIDGRPALALYKEYLGEKAKELPASGLLFPLQIIDHDNPDKKLVRTILGINEDEQAIVFAGDIPQGCDAQFMKANFDRLIDGAFQAGEDMVNRLQGKYDSGSLQMAKSESITFAVSCVGRRLVLGERAEEEVEALQESLGPESKTIGFYSYGELASHIDGSPCDLHNQSMTIMTIYELNSSSSRQAA